MYEALVALRVIDLGSLPGEGPPGEGIVLSLALLAMLAGVVLAGFGRPASFIELLAPAAAAFLVARFLTFDPYYAPALRRMSDGGLVSPLLVVALVILALTVAVLTRTWPRAGLLLTVPVILACALTALAVAVGH
ncbi:MAG: hypothetical protein ABI649_01455 [Gaiellaceae bacterium]